MLIRWVFRVDGPGPKSTFSATFRSDLAELEPSLKLVELQPGQTVAHTGDEIRTVYFPCSGIISFLVEMANGESVQTGMVGHDGVVGAAQALDDKVSVNRIVVQLPAAALAIDRDQLRAAFAHGNKIRDILEAHAQFFLADVQQTAACNALHPLEARMCRWMLRMMDLVGTEMHLTQDYLAAMLGAGRASVSPIAAQLQEKGIITYNRGEITIEDARLLEKASCECHIVVKANYTRLFKKFLLSE